MTDAGNYVSKVADEIAKEMPREVWIIVRGPGDFSFPMTRAFTDPEEAKLAAEEDSLARFNDPIEWTAGIVNKNGWYSQEFDGTSGRYRYYVQRMVVQ